MTPLEQLELAAKAMGLKGRAEDSVFVTELWFPNGTNIWNPLRDQADSDRMACKLRIETMFGAIDVYCLHGPYEATVTHDNTDEDVFRAVREARMMVAVEIGRNMK
jgi:hypothetical protein